MLFLLACIISSTLIVVTFKISEKFACKLFHLIVLNYLAATCLGFFLFDNTFPTDLFQKSWFGYAIVVGLLFIGMFFIIGKSAQIAGIAVTSVAAKMSMVIPILFSIIYFNEKNSILKIIGFLIAVASVLLTIYKKDKRKQSLYVYILPISIFLGTGVIDSLVKYAQELKIPDTEIALFSTTVFLVALLSGLSISLFRKDGIKAYFHPPTLLFGMFLGIVNFGSLFFIIKALDVGSIESSVVFAINNISIVALASIIGLVIFKEKLSKVNLAGIILALLSIYLLTSY